MKGKVILNHLRASMMYPNAVTFNIARKEVYGMEQLLSFAPSWDLIKYAKDEPMTEERWDKYSVSYTLELMQRPIVDKLFSLMCKILDSGNDIQLVCFCSNPKYCHRSLIGDLFEERGYDVIGKAKER